MSKQRNYAEVNTSYTTFFLVACIAWGLFFGSLFPETQYQSALIIILFVLLLYFIWDLIKQLYSPGQAVFLYLTVFLLLPFAMNWFLDFPYARLGIATFVASIITAGIAELVFEKIVKKRLNKKALSRLLSVDNKIDKSIIRISNNHVYLTEYKGLIFALSLAIAYFALASLLFHR